MGNQTFLGVPILKANPMRRLVSFCSLGTCADCQWFVERPPPRNAAGCFRRPVPVPADVFGERPLIWVCFFPGEWVPFLCFPFFLPEQATESQNEPQFFLGVPLFRVTKMTQRFLPWKSTRGLGGCLKIWVPQIAGLP